MKKKTKELEKKEETRILYNRNEVQKIPLLVPKGNQDFRCTYHLKPLSDERYFQLEEEIEVMNRKNDLVISEVLKPKVDLAKELFIKREGLPGKDTEIGFEDSIQAINALLYYEKVELPTIEAKDGDVFSFDEDSDECIYFGAIYSGAWLGLSIFLQSEFSSKINRYTEILRTSTRTPSYRTKQTSSAEKLYDLASPMIAKSEGYEAAKSESPDYIPARHIIGATEDFFLSKMATMRRSPIYTKIQGK